MNRIFFDIETSPNKVYSWRAGFKLNIQHDAIIDERAVICICYKYEGNAKVHVLKWDENHCDKKMLEEFAKIAAEADELVAHNGDRFDWPWFKTRCLFHGIDMFPFTRTVDTLKMAKKFYFNSNKLDYLGKYLFNDGKDKTRWQMWVDIIEKDCEKSMNKMIRYCQKDVRLLQKVWGKLAKFEQPKTHAGVLAGGDKWSCGHCGSEDVVRNKKTITAKGTIQHLMRCTKCGKYHTISEKSYRDYKEAKK